MTVMKSVYHPIAISLKTMTVFLVLGCVIVVSGCSSTIPSLGSSKPKYEVHDEHKDVA